MYIYIYMYVCMWLKKTNKEEIYAFVYEREKISPNQMNIDFV